MIAGKTKKQFTRISSLLLAAAIGIPLASAIPGIQSQKTVCAGGWYKTESNTSLGTSRITAPFVNEDPDEEWQGSYVWYGYYDGEPLLFRVLDPSATQYGGNTMLLDCAEVLFEAKHDDAPPYKFWEDSALRKNLNEGFLESAFTAMERDAIHESVRESGPAYQYNTWENYVFDHYVPLKGEKIFLLDAQDLMNPAYGYSSDSGVTFLDKTHYSFHRVDNRIKYKVDSEMSTDWWIRSASYKDGEISPIGAGLVFNDGELSGVTISKTTGSNAELGVSPAMNIKSDSVLLSSLVFGTDGKDGATYKLTLKDDNMVFSIPTGKEIRYDIFTPRKVKVPYSITGTNAVNADRLSVVFTNGDLNDPETSLFWYEKLDTGDTFATSGAATFSVPDIAYNYGTWGKDYHVYVFAEQTNDVSASDYASSFYEIKNEPVNNLVMDLRNGRTMIDEDLYNACGVAYYAGLITFEYEMGNTYIDIDKDGTRDVVIPFDKYVEPTERLDTSSVQGKIVLKDDYLKVNANIDSITFLLPEVITNVSITLPEPVAGNKPSYDAKVPSGANYYFRANSYETSKNDIEWSDVTNCKTMKVNQDSFQLGNTYSVYMDLTAKEGYVFAFPASKVNVKLNGKVVKNVSFEDNGQLCIICDYPDLKTTPAPITDKTIEIGKSFQYSVYGVDNSNIKFSVGNSSVATVDSKGNVTGKSKGNTYLYATLPDGTKIKCLIRVVYPELKISYTEKTLHMNQTFQFSASNAYGQKVTWSVGNSSVATVDQNGKVTAKSAANTYLYAKTADGRTAKCLLKVINPGTLGINYTEKTVYLGQTFTFTAKNAGILKPTWSVGNTSIAKVNSTGTVTGLKAGNTYLYVKTEDGRSAKCLVKVVDPGPLNIRYTEKTIKVGAAFQFEAKNTTGLKVTWRVGNTAVATVDANGKVTGKSVGNTWLYASTPDGRETKCLLKIVS